MQRLLLRAVTLTFALGVLAMLVGHATLTSGCTKQEIPTKEPTGPAALPSAARAVPSGAASAPGASAPVTPPNAPNAPATPGSITPNAPESSPSSSPRFMPATKSGMVIRPNDLKVQSPPPLASPPAQQAPSPQPSPGNAR